ncbi:MAG: histidine kinase [Verrucomicrobia bacterium]|nr:histidine kinase [Verrucomicrobiota bacterium]
MRFPYFPPADKKSHSPRRRWLGSGRYWLFQIGGWGMFWLVLTLGSLNSGAPEGMIYKEVLAQTLLTGTLIVCSHLMRVLLLALRSRNFSTRIFVPGLVLSIVATSAAVAGPWMYLSICSGSLGDFPQEPDLGIAFTVFLFGMSLLLGVWVCLYFGYNYYMRYQQGLVERLQLDAAIKDAELRALRAQINPHFLFNSLNTLRALIPRNLDRPREAITLLADLLRASLTMSQQRTITLAQEMETVRNYLALEQLRFEERLRVHLSIAPETCTHILPPFVLQTLVENALKFGVAPFETGGEIFINSEENAGALHLTVKNQGALNALSSGTGLGLKNARARLHLLCGPEATITLTQDGAWVVARLVVPLKPSTLTSLHS